MNLSYYSMGFLELLAPGRVELRGSGTLVRIGKTYGILTAAHGGIEEAIRTRDLVVMRQLTALEVCYGSKAARRYRR